MKKYAILFSANDPEGYNARLMDIVSVDSKEELHEHLKSHFDTIKNEQMDSMDESMFNVTVEGDTYSLTCDYDDGDRVHVLQVYPQAWQG